MSNEIVRIPFHGTEIHTTRVDGEPRVVLRPSIENMGLDASAQLKKMKTRSWATVAETATVAEDGKTRLMATANLKTWSMLLANIDENRVAPHLKQTIVHYQRESADALEAYWTQGGAINPRATEEQLDNLLNRVKAQADVLATLRGIVDPKWLESKARHLAARALGEEPEEDLLSRPLTVGEYLEDRGVKDAALRKVSMPFGRRLVNLYVAENGSAPGKVRRFVSGAHRDVYVYTEADRQAFDQVWNDMAAEALL
jgi:hypothetical protein